MLAALNSMMLDMLAAVARKDYEDRRRRQAQGVQKPNKKASIKVALSTKYYIKN